MKGMQKEEDRVKVEMESRRRKV